MSKRWFVTGLRRIRPHAGRPVLPLAALTLALILAGCESIPTSGPLVDEIMDESKAAKRYGFTLVDVNSQVLRAMTAAPHHSLREFFPDDKPVVPRIGPGDVLAINIFESGAGELFAPASAQQTTYGTTNLYLPSVTVDQSGMIAVPYAGAIWVSGSTPSEVRTLIEGRLRSVAVKPQVLVSVVTNLANVVTLSGILKMPGRYGLSAASETLLQMVALAGGSTSAASDTMVQLTRGQRQVSVRLSDLAAHPQEDVHVWPGDYVNLTLQPRTFLVYGAVDHAGPYPLTTDDVTLAEAVAQAGGPRDYQADSRGIFLFRYEYPEVLQKVPPGRIISSPVNHADAASNAMEPVIYKINFKTASGIFYATKMPLRENDLIFVPTAETVDWQKYLDILRMTATPVTQGTVSGVEMNRAF